MRQLMSRFKAMEKDFVIFLLAGVFLGIGQSVDGSVFTNYLKDRFQLLIMQRSLLEFPRELPGFLVFLIIGFLYVLGDIRIAAIANFLAATGMFLLGVIPPNYALAVFIIFIYSTGQHVYMPLANSIGMSFANDGKLGRKLGQVSAANTAALVTGSAILWLLLKYLNIGFTISFTIGAMAFAAAGVLLLLMNPKQTVKLKQRFTFKKEYGLYYWMSFLYGARKQIFITFGPWVLVDVFKQKVTTMTILFFAISVLNIFFRPFVGYLIDRVGEKLVLSAEAVFLFFVCLGYSFAEDILPFKYAIILVSICYILDQVSNAAAMARATYLKKIAVTPEDVSTTLSAGISIDHIVSMLLPALGGFVWYSSGAHGYKYVFFGGAVIALINFITTRMIKIKSPTGESVNTAA